MPGEGTLTSDTTTVTGIKIGYARVWTSGQDLTAQQEGLTALGVEADRICVDRGLTGTNRARPRAAGSDGCVPPDQRDRRRAGRRPSDGVPPSDLAARGNPMTLPVSPPSKRGVCALCGVYSEELTIEHILPSWLLRAASAEVALTILERRTAIAVLSELTTLVCECCNRPAETLRHADSAQSR